MFARLSSRAMAININKCRRTHLAKNHFSFLYMWGLNDNGQLGLGNNFVNSKLTTSPLKVETLPPNEMVHDVALGVLHTALVTKTGRVFLAGSNIYGQLGLGDHSQERMAVIFSKNLSIYKLLKPFKMLKFKI